MPNPYEIWDTRTSLGVFRDVDPVYQYWTPWFGNQINSESEYIEFDKLPVRNRRLAAFTMPLSRGKPVYDDKVEVFRLKPAYVKVEDVVDELMPLRKRAGIDSPILDVERLSPMQRLALIKTQITIEHVQAIQRTWDWLAAKAIIDGKVTLSGENYPTTLVDFQRAANHTIVLGVGERFGDTDVSIVDFFQLVIDRMTDAPFGAVPTRATMGGAVWAKMRKDSEFLDHLDTQKRGSSNITFERDLVPGEKIFKVGEMLIGGNSGQVIELWVNNETYLDPNTGVQTRYLDATDIVFTGTADAVMGYRCFGRIIDRAANYEPLPIFPRNWLDENSDPVTEFMSHKSAPLMVPINPNATLKATVVAAS